MGACSTLKREHYDPSSSLFLAVHIQPDAPAVEYRQPQLGAGNGIVAMAYGAGKSIYFTSSADNGRTFGPPVVVAGDVLVALGRHRGPRVSVLPNAIVITAVAGKTVAEGPHAHGLPSDGDLRVWRSTDSGKTWSLRGLVNDVPAAAREGLHAMASDRKGNLLPPGSTFAPKAPGSMAHAPSMAA